MPRKERITEPGFYHVISRGVEKRNVFLKPSDYYIFLDILVLVFKKSRVILHTYCLMTNHYHLLLETTENNISDIMRQVNSLYSIYFNKKYERTGHLWQGRFKSYYLYDETHFWVVAKYIERNPIKAAMVSQVQDYKYQSFFERKYKDQYFKLIEKSMMFNMTFKEYEDFISSEMQMDLYDTVFVSPKYISKDGKMKVLSKRLEIFFEEDRDINRNKNIKSAYTYGYTKTEIARFLELSASAIAKIV